MVGKVVLALVPLVVVELEPMNDQYDVGRLRRDMVLDMEVVVVVGEVEGPYGGQCSARG